MSNNPLKYIDPTGESETAVGLAMIGTLFVHGTRATIVAVTSSSTFNSGKQIVGELTGSSDQGVGEFLGNNLKDAALEGALAPVDLAGASPAVIKDTYVGYETSDAETQTGKALDAAAAGAVSVETEIITKTLPGVKGRDVSTFSDHFMNGAHTKRVAATEAIKTTIKSGVEGIKSKFNGDDEE